jgi:Uma2 family endonuclease
MVDRPQMLVSEFEDLARSASENVRLEFVYGKLGVKAVPDSDHDEILRRISKHLLRQRPELWLYPERGLKVETYRDGRLRPDGTLAADGAFAGVGEWADPRPVLAVVEVTSFDSDTNRRDRVEKPRAYAEAEIPVYLLVDRDKGETLVYSKPADGNYTTVLRLPFGKSVDIPDPVGVALDTEPFRAWVR